MGYSENANKSAKKYKSKSQKQIALSYQIDEYELEVLPAIKASGLPVATYIKQAVKEKIEAGDPAALTLDTILEYVKKKTVRDVPKALSNKCRKIILYGSYARGNYTEDSDVDIAILTDSDRIENQKYNAKLDDIATQIGYKTTAVVNYVCLPLKEFEERKNWYPYFANIERDGVLLYERK